MNVTIEKIAMSGKWMEFWFKEGDVFEQGLPFHASSKSGYFWEAVEKEGLMDEVTNLGVQGMGMIWEKNGYNFEIAKVISKIKT
jgi:hypothetical protein